MSKFIVKTKHFTHFENLVFMRVYKKQRKRKS